MKALPCIAQQPVLSSRCSSDLYWNNGAEHQLEIRPVLSREVQDDTMGWRKKIVKLQFIFVLAFEKFFPHMFYNINNMIVL